LLQISNYNLLVSFKEESKEF